MRPTPPRARYDSPWKAALTHAFRAFMAFFYRDLYPLIDWSRRPRFLDKELAQVGIGDQPEGRVADKLVAIWLLDGSEQWILVHIEVQAQRDEALALRVLDYNFRIFDQYERPVASLVLLADDDPHWRPHAFHNCVLGTVMGISFATAKLLDYAGRDAELQASRNPFALVTLAHLRTQQTRHAAQERFAAKWQLTKLLYQRGWSKKRIIILFKVINWMMTLPEALQLRYRRAFETLGRTHQMEWIDPYDAQRIAKAEEKGRKHGWRIGLKEGKAEGRAEGREEGRGEGAALLLERQLTTRFGPLPQTVRRRLAKASLEQLAHWSEILLDAQSLRQVFK